METKVTVLEALQQKRRFIKKNAGQIRGKVKLAELFTPSFMREHTKLADIQEFFGNSDFKIVTKADMRAIPDDLWNKYIASISDFSTWREMFCTATAEYLKGKLSQN